MSQRAKLQETVEQYKKTVRRIIQNRNKAKDERKA